MSENGTGIPIVRLEVEGMRHTIQMAVTDHLLNMDVEFRTAVEQAVSTFEFERIVKEEVMHVMRESIRTALQHATYDALRTASVKSTIEWYAQRAVADFILGDK